jgi:putative membrane protein
MADEHVPPNVDLRVLQANERTLLAWLRTGIALMAFGFVVARAGAWLRYLANDTRAGTGTFAAVGVAFVALGTLVSALAGMHHLRIRRAVLRGGPVPLNRLAPVVVGLVVLIGAVLVVLLAVRKGL